MKTQGFDKLIKQLNKIQEEAEKMKEQKEYPLSELLTPQFLNKHSNYNSLEEFLKDLPCSTEEINGMSIDEKDKYVASKTNFSSWDDMFTQAYGDMFAKRIKTTK